MVRTPFVVFAVGKTCFMVGILCPLFFASWHTACPYALVVRSSSQGNGA